MHVWPLLPIELEHAIASIIIQQGEDGIRFNKEKAVELSRQLLNAQATVGRELIDHFGSWWQPQDDPNAGKPFANTMKRKLKEHKDVTVERRGKRGQLLKPYRGAPLEERDEGSPFVRMEWTEFSPGSRDHLASRLTALYGWVPKEFGKDKKPKLDETVISEIPEHIVPKVLRVKVLEYFKLTKTLGMLSVGRKAWLHLVGEDGRMHGRMDTVGTITGRATHSDPNLSQVPAVRVDKKDNPVLGIAGGFGYECRELFEADPGWELTGIDVNALELVLLGHCLAGPGLVDGEQVSSLDGGAFSARVCDPTKDIHNENSKLTGVPRQETKTCIYLYVNGGGAWRLTFEIDIAEDEIPKYLGYKGLPSLLAGLRKRFGDTYKMPDDRGKALLAKARTILLAFEKGITGIKDLKATLEAAAAKGWIRGIDGRKLVVKKAFNGLNSAIQGNGAIVCKLWIVLTHRNLKAAGLKHGVDYKQVLWSHDEIQITHRPGLGPQIAALSEAALVEAGETLKLRGRLRSASKTGLNWATCH